MSNDNLIFYEKRKVLENISVLGVPLDLGKDAVGTTNGPEYLRKHGLKEMCQEVGLVCKDLGDVECVNRKKAEMGDKKVKYLDEISRVCEKTAQIVKNEITLKNKMVVLVGDHSIAIGTIAGASAACKGDLGVIWLDAHGDMMTSENTHSGNIHGMPSAVAMGLGHHKLVNILGPGAKIKKENIVYGGLKDLDQEEIDLINKENLQAFTIMDILRDGLEPLMASIKELSQRVNNVWVSLDIDCIDAEYAPGTLMPNAGGFTRREIENITKFIGKTCKVVGMDLVELAPKLDVDNKTASLAVGLIANLLGSEYSWYTQYMNKSGK